MKERYLSNVARADWLPRHAGDVDAAGGGVGEGMGDAAAVSYDIQPLELGFQVLVHLYLHVVELHLHAVKQGVLVGGAGSNLVHALYQ